MLCPYRQNQRVERKYKDYQGNGMFFDIQSTFAECYREDCPYYLSSEELNGKDGDQCRKVWAETFDTTAKVMAIIANGDD